MSKGLVLIADDDAAIRTVLNQAFTRAGFTVRVTSVLSTLWKWVSEGEGDLVITDVSMPDGDAFEFLPKFKRVRPTLPIIVISAQNTFMTAIKASERGAYEYLPKPFDLQELISVSERAVLESGEKNIEPDEKKPFQDMPLIGRSSAMQDVYRVLARLMQNDLTLLITGESGTGKELVARALHEYGKRKNGPFVAINMVTIPKDQIESELFGYEKGAFDGAVTYSSGRFGQCEGGTLFLDEIGDMPMDVQSRLLRVLQKGEYTTVGGRAPIKTDIRIVAATNRDLHTLIGQGKFREDLFFRLNVVPLRIPPLRERCEDIPDLVQHFLSLNAKAGLGEKSIDVAGIEAMRKYLWPGNVRELENLIVRLTALYSQDSISGEIVRHELSSGDFVQGSDTNKSVVSDISIATENWLGEHFKSYPDENAPAGLYKQVLTKMEVPLILASLAYTGGNQIRTAELLGLNRNTLRKKIKELDIKFNRMN